MKRVGYLYDKICDTENCKQAILNASRHKRVKRKKYIDGIDDYAAKLSKMLKSKTYMPAPYHKFKHRENSSGKEREISATRFFPDRGAHWAVIQVVGDVLRRGTYTYSCAGIKGRGTLYASQAVRRWLKNDPQNTKYCLKLDIRRFYPSVDHEILMKLLGRLIKDKDVLDLLGKIIDLEDGIPIGTVLSPYFADVILQPVDYLIKQELGCKYYARYADDMVVFGRDKQELHKAFERIRERLSELGLEVKGDWQVFLVERTEKRGRALPAHLRGRVTSFRHSRNSMPTALPAHLRGRVTSFRHSRNSMPAALPAYLRGRKVDFCGWAVSHTTVRVRKRIALRIMRLCRRLARGNYTHRLCTRYWSYYGWIKHGACNAFREKYINGLNFEVLRSV